MEIVTLDKNYEMLSAYGCIYAVKGDFRLSEKNDIWTNMPNEIFTYHCFDNKEDAEKYSLTQEHIYSGEHPTIEIVEKPLTWEEQQAKDVGMTLTEYRIDQVQQRIEVAKQQIEKEKVVIANFNKEIEKVRKDKNYKPCLERNCNLH